MKFKAATIYVAACVFVALLAKARGRSGFAWFLLAFALTPVLAGGLVLIMSRGKLEPSVWR